MVFTLLFTINEYFGEWYYNFILNPSLEGITVVNAYEVLLTVIGYWSEEGVKTRSRKDLGF